MLNYRKVFIILFFFAIFLISPLATFSIGGCRQPEVPIPGLTTTCLPALPDYIVAIYNFALMIIGIVCFGALIYGGFRWLTSAGNPAALADAKDQIFSAILGLIILFSAYLILTTINPELVILGVPGGKCAKNADCPTGQECVGGICFSSAYPVLPGGGNLTNCSSYIFSGDCTNAGCKWCPECSGNLVNSWKTDKCVDSGIDCGYTCVVGECEATSCD